MGRKSSTNSEKAWWGGLSCRTTAVDDGNPPNVTHRLKNPARSNVTGIIIHTPETARLFTRRDCPGYPSSVTAVIYLSVVMRKTTITPDRRTAQHSLVGRHEQRVWRLSPGGCCQVSRWFYQHRWDGRRRSHSRANIGICAKPRRFAGRRDTPLIHR